MSDATVDLEEVILCKDCGKRMPNAYSGNICALCIFEEEEDNSSPADKFQRLTPNKRKEKWK